MQVAFAYYMRLRNINSATPSTTLDKLYHSELDHQQQQKTLQVLWTKVFNKWIKTHTNVDKSGGAKILLHLEDQRTIHYTARSTGLGNRVTNHEEICIAPWLWRGAKEG